MDVRKIIDQHKTICRLISEKRVKQSLDILRIMVSLSSSGQFRDEYENLTQTYRNILRYTIEGIKDPEREKIYTILLKSILNLADRVRQDILSHYSGWYTYWLKQQVEKEYRLSGRTIVEKVDDLLFKQELDEWLKLSEEINPDPDSEIARKHKQLIRNIFNHLWLTDTYGEAEDSLVTIIRKSGKFRWYESCIFVSAITLSLLRFWQAEKVKILIGFYQDDRDQVSERALAGLILSLHYYNERIMFHPDILSKIKKLTRNASFKEHCRIMVMQAIRSRETEKLSKRLQDEILPKVASFKPRLDEKLDLENILPGSIGEDKNPNWSKIFNESDEIFKTMEELTNLQMEGADVYMSAFANLKHFDFFKDIQNWFVPFYPDHEAVDVIYNDEVLGPGINELAEALYQTPFICNSDKYSLLLNLKYLPAAQKTMMLKVFRMELDGLEQMSLNESGTDPLRTFRIHITQYLQDLYRFFKLSPYKKDFEDVFSGRLDIYNSEFYRIVCPSPEAELSLADYFFSKDYFDDALELFLRQIVNKPDDAQLYEKIGYCYQQADLYEEALTYYRRAELVDRKAWTIKKIGLCLRHLGKFEESLEYYLQAADMEPGNIHTVIMIAHCYLDLRQYEQALKYYFKVEYMEPGNIKILRPIAWCCLALGKLTDSEKYYERLSAEKLNAHDYINRGHLAFCMGRKKDAVEFYRRGLAVGGVSRDDFIRIFNEDKPMLIGNGIDPGDIPILIDYLFYILE
ncbi:MAG: tetratricopeptide repeat protein [Bacteroidales bacterium]